MRKPLVSRTMIVSEVTAEIINIATEETEEKLYVLPRTYKDERKIEKKLITRIQPGYKLIKILKVNIARYLYAMNEQEFIDHAHKINGYKVSDTGAVFGPYG